MSDSIRQAVKGFKVSSFNIKKGKETEKIKLVLEANVEDIASAEYDVGDVLNSVANHMTGDQEIGLSLFIKK